MKDRAIDAGDGVFINIPIPETGSDRELTAYEKIIIRQNKKINKPCTWKAKIKNEGTPEQCVVQKTGCGKMWTWTIISEHNNFKYCPYCGGKIQEVL